MSVRVVLDPRALAELLRSPSGPVYREMLVAGELVRQEARRRVGVHQPLPKERRDRKPGQLRDSIVKRVEPTGDGFRVLVGSDDPVARLHHEGTEPHTIVPRKAKVLAFPTRDGMVFTHRVEHPGTKPNPFLTDALAMLRGRY